MNRYKMMLETFDYSPTDDELINRILELSPSFAIVCEWYTTKRKFWTSLNMMFYDSINQMERKKYMKTIFLNQTPIEIKL